MLLRNESRVRHSIVIKLVFDDNRVRRLELFEDDKVQMSYRKNGCLKCGVGVVREIKPYIHNKKWPYCNLKESAIIVLDMSEDHVACVDKIDLFDIIDIRKIVPECSCGCNQPEPDFDIKAAGCLVGCPVTEKGVVTRE